MVVDLPEGDPGLSTVPNPLSSDLHRTASSAIESSNVDPRLISDLNEFFPLLQSFLDQERKPASSFTRRAAMVYTKTPLSNRDFVRDFYVRLSEQKSRIASQPMPTKGADNLEGRGFISDAKKNLVMEADKEELMTLKKQVEDFHTALSEKNQLLQSEESLKCQMSSVQEALVELKHQSAEKDSLLKANQLQLSDLKIELANKQAAIEKTQWEAMQSKKKIEELQEVLDRMNGECSSYMQLLEGLLKNDDRPCIDNYDIQPCPANFVPELDGVDETQIQNIEEAVDAYIDTLAIAKGNDDEDSISDAMTARLHLQSLVFKSQGVGLFEAKKSG